MRTAIMLRYVMLAGGLVSSQSACHSYYLIEGGSNEAYNRNPMTVAIPEKVGDASALNAAESALVKRHWEIRSKTDDEIVGGLQDFNRDLTVTIKSDSGRLILYSDSVHFADWARGATEVVPYKELAEIQGDIRRSLSRYRD